MEDSQKNKEKGGYSQWGPEETKLLIDLLVDAIHRNWRDANGLINKFTMEQNFLPVLNEKIGCQKEHKHYLNEVWDEYLKKHPTHKHLRYDSVEKYEDLQIIFGNGVATGGFAIGMGDSTDARTFRVEDISQTRENINLHQSSDEVFELSSQQPSTECEKLHPRKMSRREADTNADKLKNDQDDSMIIVSNKILSVIQQREEIQQREAEKRAEKLKREAEEKEADRKKNSIWETMKEIPNLDNHTRFKFGISLCVTFYVRKTTIDADVTKRTTFGSVTTGDFAKVMDCVL
ncbi:BnaC02g11660D [Brassica napus]|uniref:BnaC02g11660D protein n=1 Tax=Brassica napus TaxID=3708 RepID=A0A078HY27_BRANA|nr:BnaC02g11660D [Brassica napus]